MGKVSFSVYNYTNNRLCELYDSDVRPLGQAYDVMHTQELNGLKELTFSIDKFINGEKNFRWDFIKNKYKIRYVNGDYVDWFVIDLPNGMLEDGMPKANITCNHTSMSLSKKNLYLLIDDTNGIGTIQTLMNLVLTGTGWTLGTCDTFYESDGTTEKVRSLKSEGKEGSYTLITNICNLFNAYPVYNGNDQTVDIYSKKVKDGLIEFNYGKNINGLTKSQSSNTLITRLYIEGEYDEDGYISIESVNPTGLSYLMNFDYYKELGVFTQDHQNAYDSYITNMTSIVSQIKTASTTKNTLEDNINNLVGQIKYVIYKVTSGSITNTYKFNGATDTEATMSSGDVLIVDDGDNTYSHQTYDGTLEIPTGCQFILKYVDSASGLIGAKEVSVEAKEKMIVSLQEDYDNETDTAKKAAILVNIEKYQDEIADLYAGTSSVDGLYHLVSDLINYSYQLNTEDTTLASLHTSQINTENTFVNAIGDMLEDGYWNNENYIVGQEALLYADAQEYIKVISRPKVTYSATITDLSSLTGYELETFKLNMSARIYDENLEVNDYVFITKIITYPDTPWENAVDISNDELDLQSSSLESTVSRLAEIANQLIGKNGLIRRANAISRDGTINTSILQGMIDADRQKIFSTISSWETDNNGNIVFNALDGLSTMLLSGNGFMIANGKNTDGSWRYRTFGTGQGFTADLITTGTLATARLEPSVGNQIDISGNVVITTMSQNVTDLANSIENINTNGLMLKTNYNSFTNANDGSLYLHGIESGTPADVDGFITYNGETVTVSKQSITPGAVLPESYIVIDNVGAFIAYHNNSNNTWYRYPENTTFALSPSHMFIGYAEMDESGVFTYAILWSDVSDFKRILDIADLKSAIAENNARLEVLSNSITGRVERTTYDELAGTVTTNYTEYKQDADGFTRRIGSTEASLISVGNNLTTLNTFKSKQELMIREDDLGIHVGKDGYKAETLVANDGLHIKDNYGNECAYFTDSKSFIKNAQITESMQIGSVKFVKYSTGRMSLKWIG